MRSVIYARFSSHLQRGESIEDQVRVCSEAAAREGDEVLRVYSDEAVSGTTDRRDAFREMVSDAASRSFGRVWVYKLDRFARNRYDAAVHRRLLEKRGVEVRSASEQIPEGPVGVLVESLLDGLAEYYSANLSENVRRGLRGNALKCHPNGQRRYGWRIAGARIDGAGRYRPGDRYEVDEAEAAWVREMYAMRAEGHAFAAIARELAGRGCVSTEGRPVSKAVVSRILRDEAYRGVYRHSDAAVEGGIPRIVDDGLWMAAQELDRAPRRADRIDDLSGMDFGHLRVICYMETRKRHRRWLCRCSACGGLRVEWGTRLTTGLATHCGCLSGDGGQRDALGRFIPL